MRHFAEYLRTVFTDIEVTIDEQIESEDRVVTRWGIYATHRGELWGIPATGRRVRLSGITINRLAAGQIAEEWCQADWFGLLQQISGFLTGPEYA